jgi:exopolysaccharide biosynthesis polyprenyl glycosylphosphotransferase
MQTVTPVQEVQPDTNKVQYHIPAVSPRSKPGYLAVKRGFDFFVALMAGMFFLLPMLVIALIIKLDSPGPALFKQERVGKNGKAFTMLKFRSMRDNAEENGPQWAEKDDERCTGIGRILRKTRLDELPQLWNILVGHMSFVGPRPERACFYEEFETYIHGFSNRLVVRPGLTGWAQINGGYDLKPEEKIVYDMEYIEKRSLWMDLKCIFRTVKLVFTHEGAR